MEEIKELTESIRQLEETLKESHEREIEILAEISTLLRQNHSSLVSTLDGIRAIKKMGVVG